MRHKAKTVSMVWPGGRGSSPAGADAGNSRHEVTLVHGFGKW